jgi:hypothetical protein
MKLLLSDKNNNEQPRKRGKKNEGDGEGEVYSSDEPMLLLNPRVISRMMPLGQ